jgi:hypothetical protein
VSNPENPGQGQAGGYSQGQGWPAPPSGGWGAPGSGWPGGPPSGAGYGAPDGAGLRPGPRENHPKAVTALILGLLAIAFCPLTAPFAWSQGKTAQREIDADPQRWEGRTIATIGYVLGLVLTIVYAAAIVLGILAVLFFVVFAAATSTTGAALVG